MLYVPSPGCALERRLPSWRKRPERWSTATGFRTLKVKTGQGWDVDKAALSEIRSAVGPEVQIMADANDGYTASEALDYLKNLGEMGVTYAEDPCQLRPNRAFEKLQAESPIPILVDRASSGSEAAALFLERGAEALSVKTGGTGIGEARRMAELALTSIAPRTWGVLSRHRWALLWRSRSIARCRPAAIACPRRPAAS